MENNNKIRELYSIYLELGHEVFEEKIKKPMELYLHASSNVITMNSSNTIIVNGMEIWKVLSLGILVLMSMIFLVPQARRRKFTLMILCLLYMMIKMMNMIFSFHLLLKIKFIMIMICLLNTMITMMVMIVLLPLLPMRKIMLMWRVR